MIRFNIVVAVVKSLLGEWTTDVSTLFQSFLYEIGRHHVKALQAAAISPYFDLTQPTGQTNPHTQTTTPGSLNEQYLCALRPHGDKQH